ncbi:MAG: hypothetical protein NZ874_01450 [Fimbriimonadales bacterium]|nr:hypothetical protein [Fimbriimonadales bacterium]
MSVGDKRVECAPALKQRLALVHLRSREWQQVRELLESALEVRFRPLNEEQNRWVLEPDPEVARRNLRLREQFAQRVQKSQELENTFISSLLEAMKQGEAGVEQLISRWEIDEWVDSEALQQRREETRALLGLLRDAPIANAKRNWRRYFQLEADYQAFLDESTDAENAEANIQQFLKTHPLSRYGFSEQELQWVQQQVASGDRELWKKILQDSASGLDSAAATLLITLFLGRTARAQALEEIQNSLLKVFQAEVQPLNCILQGAVEREQVLTLPAEQLALLLSDWNRTYITQPDNELLKVRLGVMGEWSLTTFGYTYGVQVQIRSLAGKYRNDIPPVTLRFGIYNFFSDATPQLLKKVEPDWYNQFRAALQQHQQWLQSDIVQRPFRKELSLEPLIESVRVWAYEQNQEVIMEALEVFARQSFIADSLAKSWRRLSSPQLLEQRQGVWIVRHWAPFLARVRDYPLASLRRLCRSQQSYSDWRRFYQETSSTQIRQLLHDTNIIILGFTKESQVFEFSFNPAEIAGAWLITSVLEGLPENQRSRMLQAINRKDTVRMPVSSLPAQVQQRLRDTILLWRPVMSNSDFEKIRAQLYQADTFNSWIARWVFVMRDNQWSVSVLEPNGELSVEIWQFSYELDGYPEERDEP